VALAGLLQNVVKRPTKKGGMMARFEIADTSGARELVAFGRTFDDIAGLLEEDAPAVVVCEIGEDGEALRLVAERLVRWDRREAGSRAGDPRLRPRRPGRPPTRRAALLARRPCRTGPRRTARAHRGRHRPLRADGVNVDPEGLAEIAAACPWLRTTVALDVRSYWLEPRARGRTATGNGGGGGRGQRGRGGGDARPAEVPF
jgi:DNA polymerase III subunit alpha